MKKRIAFRKLGRTPSHKMAMLRNMVTSLITHERIVTTVPKAKELRHLADHLITLAKKQDERKLHAIQQANAIVREKTALTKLFEVLGPRYEQRQGGYTRILKLSKPRAGDKAPMAVMEYVDRPGELRAARPPASFQQMGVLADVLKEMGITPLNEVNSMSGQKAVEVFQNDAKVTAEESVSLDAVGASRASDMADETGEDRTAVIGGDDDFNDDDGAKAKAEEPSLLETVDESSGAAGTETSSEAARGNERFDDETTAAANDEATPEASLERPVEGEDENSDAHETNETLGGSKGGDGSLEQESAIEDETATSKESNDGKEK